jgi:hypothetical protein
MNILSDLSVLFRSAMRVLRAALVPALALGYTAFYSIFPSATFPVMSDASFVWILIVLVLASLVGGIEANELRELIVAGMVALPLGFGMAVFLVFTPAFAGLYFLEPSAVPFFVAHYAILALVLSFPVNLVGGVVGQFVRDRFVQGRIPNRLPP